MESDTILIIEPGRLEKAYFHDLWKYRELFLFISWRDILIRYRQTTLGMTWSILRPLLMMIIFTFVFQRLAKFPSPIGIPYPILIYVAVLPWHFFANSFSEASNSLLSNSSMLTKIYFPRLIMPTSSVIINFVDFSISFVMLFLMMAWYHFCPSWKIIFLPIFLLMAFALALGAGYFVSALNVHFRDFRHVVPFMVQTGLYISPVGFSSNILPESWRFWYYINPMASIIDGFRFSLLGGENTLYWPGLCMAIFLIISIFWGGLRYFRKMERTFADII